MTTDSQNHTGASPTPGTSMAPLDTCPPEPQGWSGPICPSCHREEFRFRDGVCIYCYNNREAKTEAVDERKRTRRYVGMLLSRGLITLGQARRGEY